VKPRQSEQVSIFNNKRRVSSKRAGSSGNMIDKPKEQEIS